MARLLTGFVAMTCAAAVAAAEATELHPLSNAFIDLINSKQNSWTAGRNFPEDTPMEYLRRLTSRRRENKTLLDQLPVIEHKITLRANLPENFDPREKWPNCPSLNEIRDQGSCGSGWAFAAVSAMTDRYCIQSNGQQFHFSAEDLLSCSQAGDCEGGSSTARAWIYWAKHGLVSGGNYGSKQGCRPYSIEPCIHFGPDQDGLKNCTGSDTPTPACEQECIEGYEVPYQNDLKRGKNIHMVRGDENTIMAELYESGPVEGNFEMFEDFLHYKSGVYRHTEGKRLGWHSVKLLGWGAENGNKYWLIANSWNEHFGDRGFFKILRGTNECHIEYDLTAGNAKI